MGTATSTTTAALSEARALRVDLAPVERAIAALGDTLTDVEVLADQSASYAGVRARLAGGHAALLAFHATLAPADFRGRIWRNHARSITALLARPGTPFVRLETRAGMPGLVTVGVDQDGLCTLDDAITFLATATEVKPDARDRLRTLLRSFGTTVACIGDRMAPPGLLTKTVWMRPEGDVVRAADHVAETLELLPAHRTLLARHLSLGLPRWIGLRTSFDALLPEIHVAFDADPALAARLLGDTGHDEVRALIRGRSTIEMRYHAEGAPIALVRMSPTASPAAVASPGSAGARSTASAVRSVIAPSAKAPVISKDDLSFGVIAGRLGAAAATTGIAITPLLAALQPFGAALGRHTRVTMTGEADRLRVLFPVPRDPAGKAAVVELLRGTPVPDANTNAHVELATIPRKQDLEVWLHVEGSPTWDRLAGLIDDPTKLRELMTMIDPSGPRTASRRIGTRDAIVQGIVGGDRAAAVIGKLAEAVSISPAQRKLIGQIHPLLAHGADTIVGLRIGELGNVVPEVRVVYRAQPLETVVRVVAPLRPGADAGKALGNLAGALAATQAALTLVLRPEDPMRALIAIDLVPGTDLA